MLKTDQGPAGNFLGFQIEDRLPQDVLRFDVARESGLAVRESFFKGQYDDDGQLPAVVRAIGEVQKTFQKGEEHECLLALERLEIACQAEGLTFRRSSAVGRLPFFFIRPAETAAGPIRLPLRIAACVQQEVVSRISQVEQAARTATVSVREGRSRTIEEIKEAGKKESLNCLGSSDQGVIYCQPDVILRSDGTFELERLNIPDVGLFLTRIELEDAVFSPIQEVVQQLAKVVIEKIRAEIRRHPVQRVCILTRDPVLNADEDTLEIREIEVLTEALLGMDVEVRALSEVAKISKGTFVLLLNVRPEAPGFGDLLRKFAQGDLLCYPDPFTLLFKDEFTSLPRRRLSPSEMSVFREIADPRRNTSADYLRQLLALDGFLCRLGFSKENIFYFHNGNRERAAAAFRYDPYGFALALNQFTNEGIVYLEGLKFLPEEAVVIGPDGPRLAAFRFMCVSHQGGK
ncbi:hypothetical protein ACFLZP_01000 [Patescibacteria group bacterium]